MRDQKLNISQACFRLQIMTEKKTFEITVECAWCGHEWPLEVVRVDTHLEAVNKDDYTCLKCGRRELRK
jgi:hypothetical protein